MNHIKPGNHITWKGYNWIVLDPSVESPEGTGVFLIMANIYYDVLFQFDTDQCNNYSESSLREMLNRHLLPELGEDNILPHVVDLTADNGDTKYGTIKDKVFILSCDEYRKYRKYIPPYDECMWTCTPWYIINGFGEIRVVTGSGYLIHRGTDNCYGVAPACVVRADALDAI